MQNYQRYRIWLKKGEITNKKLLYPEDKKISTFIKPSTEKELSKLYVIKHQGKIVYVGITKQSISNRLRHGLKAKGKKGYWGYKWKNLKSVDLYIFTFKKNIASIEAIEAEIVYLVRNKTGRWPEFQTEIHFHNSTKEEGDIARKIFNIVEHR